MREGTTSRVTAADRLYGEFYDFYSVSPENFGSTLVCIQYYTLYMLLFSYYVWPEDGLIKRGPKRVVIYLIFVH
jgi:hypothetical protein